jgi:hypothetical protein
MKMNGYAVPTQVNTMDNSGFGKGTASGYGWRSSQLGYGFGYSWDMHRVRDGYVEMVRHGDGEMEEHRMRYGEERGVVRVLHPAQDGNMD